MKVLRLPKVLASTGLSRSSIYAMSASGQFPKPVRLGKRAVGWIEDEVIAWLASREAMRGAA
ncbi:AlpA family transcriptional regulator [Rhodobacter sp. CZR27]|uniref:helix-turn-helix transcriptional regulator n=1 Tax=Rhodobacter sp. CZR27 TaxID=2033869 RepID=UPI000BBEDA49|nr:AlpA family transcriptional regulator [Rhodobacter sp. CZR27]